MITATPTTAAPALNTHTAVGHWVRNGRRTRGSAVKFGIIAGLSLEDSGKAKVVRLFGLSEEEAKGLTVDLKALKAPKRSARIVIQHDYVMVRVVFNDGTLNLTSARYSVKASGDHATAAHRTIGKTIFGYKGKLNVGQYMEAIRAAAESSATYAEFEPKALAIFA